MNLLALKANEPVFILGSPHTVQDWSYPPGICVVKLRRDADGKTIRITDSKLFELSLIGRLTRPQWRGQLAVGGA